MLTEIPSANQYYLIPIEDFKSEAFNEETDGALFVGGKGVLNELAKYMDDDMVLAVTGLEDTRCMIIVSQGREECESRIRMAKTAFDQGVEALE